MLLILILMQNNNRSIFVVLCLQEGPHSTLPEDEFFDAVETGLDKIEEDRQLRVRLKLQSQQVDLITFVTHCFSHRFELQIYSIRTWCKCADCVVIYSFHTSKLIRHCVNNSMKDSVMKKNMEKYFK